MKVRIIMHVFKSIFTLTVFCAHIFTVDTHAAAENDARVALVAGMIAGATEPCIMQPLTTLKNRAQFSKQAAAQLPALSIRELWRGATVAAVCLGINTGIQTGIHAAIMPYVQNQLLSSLGAGALSAYIIAGPAELIIAQQQLHGTTAKNTFQSVYKHAGLRTLWRGTSWCAAREALFTAGYLSLAPECAEQFKKKGVPALPAQIVGGVCGGIVAMVLSHSADTIKTRIMADVPHGMHGSYRYRTGLDVVKEMSGAEGSLKPLFKGLVPRVVNGTFAITWFALAGPYIQKQIVAAQK